jgi:hypothetical protein
MRVVDENCVASGKRISPSLQSLLVKASDRVSLSHPKLYIRDAK